MYFLRNPPSWGYLLRVFREICVIRDSVPQSSGVHSPALVGATRGMPEGIHTVDFLIYWFRPCIFLVGGVINPDPLQQFKQHTRLSQLPDDLFDATYNAIIQIPIQTRAALQQLNRDTAVQLAEIHNSHILSAQQKTDQIQRIEQQAAQRRIQIEHQANRAKIQSFQKVVQNFITGIGRMIAEQLKLRAAAAITNTLVGTQTTATRPDTSDNPISSIISTFVPVLASKAKPRTRHR